jgi:hypothetical protein
MALPVLGAAVVSYEHANAPMRAQGSRAEPGALSPDGGRADLREFDGVAGLDAEQCPGARVVPVAAWRGHCRDANCA